MIIDRSSYPERKAIEINPDGKTEAVPVYKKKKDVTRRRNHNCYTQCFPPSTPYFNPITMIPVESFDNTCATGTFDEGKNLVDEMSNLKKDDKSYGQLMKQDLPMIDTCDPNDQPAFLHNIFTTLRNYIEMHPVQLLAIFPVYKYEDPLINQNIVDRVHPRTFYRVANAYISVYCENYKRLSPDIISSIYIYLTKISMKYIVEQFDNKEKYQDIWKYFQWDSEEDIRKTVSNFFTLTFFDENYQAYVSTYDSSTWVRCHDHFYHMKIYYFQRLAQELSQYVSLRMDL
jgi:hypothetical protein